MSMMKAGLKQGVLAFALIAIILPLVIIGGVFLSYFEHETTAEINDDNLHLAGIIRDGVTNSLKAPRRTLNVVAGLAVHPEFSPHIDDLMAQMVSGYGFFESIMVLDGNGIVRHLGTASNVKLNRRDYLGLDLSESEHVATARRLKKQTWSDTYISPLTGEPTLSLTVPFDRGMVVGNFNFAELTTAVEQHLSQSHDRIYLVNSKGRIIAHPQKTLVLQQVNVSNLPVVSAGLEGREGIYEYDVDGVEFIGAVVIIPETNWLVIVERDKGEVFHSLRNMQWFFAIALVGALLLVAFFIGYVNTRIIKPVVEISATTKSVANGIFSRIPHYEGKFNELNDLAGNFNTMTTALQEREQDLADKNRDLEEEVERRILSEEDVRLSEAKLRLILENSPHAVYVLSSEGQGLYVNAPAETLTGYDRDELLGMHFLDFVHPEDRDTLLKRREARLAGKQVENRYMFRILDRTGAVHWVENQVTMLSWEGNPAAINFLQDVTARKQAEDARAASQRFSDALIDGMPGIFYLYDSDLRLRRWNHNHEEQLGYTAAELEGKHISTWHARAESRQAAIAGVQTIMRDGGTAFFEGTLLHRDGREIPYLLSATSIQTDNGTMMFGFGVDITKRKQTEEALRSSEERYRGLFETAGDAIFLMDGEHFVDCNPSTLKMFGCTRDQIIGAPPYRFSPPFQPDGRASTEKALEMINRALDGMPQRFEWKHATYDGRIFDAEVILNRLDFGSGRSLQAIVRDMSERKRAEEALRESEDLYRGFFATSRDSVSIVSPEDRIIDFNDASLHMFGYDSREELSHIVTSSLFAHPDEMSRAIELLDREGYIQEYPTQLKRRDGTLIDVLVTAVLLRKPDGTIKARMSVIRDVTEKKKAEAEREKLIADIQKALGMVSRSQKEWQDTFDSITDMISIHDKDYNVIRANKAFSANLGLSPREVINRKCYDLLHHGASSPVPGCPHVQTMKNKVHVSEEVFDEITNKTYNVSTDPYFSPDGEFIGSIHISRDITEEKERDMRMIMTERLASLGQMASGIAHEINNPLESVMICAEMLLMRVAKDTYDHAQFEKYLKIIDEEVLRCRDITGNMLSFSRQTTTNRSNIDVHFLLDRACDLLGYQGRLKNVIVTKKYGEKFLVSGNEGELRQVFLVLLINALDAMENKGAITVETGMEAGGAWVRISDTGPGIAPENLQRIFNPFFSTKTEKGGTGLGLSIAHRIMANHQGSITVVSEQGHGAAFTVNLPR